LLEAIEKDPDETYPVIMWSDGIEDSKIENIVKEEIGYNLESLEEEYSAPSKELIAELNKAAEDSPEDSLELLMSRHMELTESARAVEQKKTDIYRETRRNILSELNVSANSSLLDELNIADDKVGFISNFAPMVICFMTGDEIMFAAENERVSELTLYNPQKWEECSINLGTTKTTMGINKINNSLNLTGSGVKIGIYETYTVSPEFADSMDLDYSKVSIIGPEFYGTSHSTYCAGIAAGVNGVAPDAEIYSSTCEYDWQSFVWNDYSNAQLSNLEELIDHGVDLISISWGSANNEDCYNNWAKYLDSLISGTSTTIVCATGNNSSGYILNPSSAYNCIAVNGFVDQYNGQAQELLNDYAYKNGNGCLKPDVIGPSLNNGTSTATPYIAGIIALMYQYKPSLAASPELTKAILMGSCHRKCSKLLTGSTISNLSETMTQGLTNRQGAGIPDIYRMISIVSQHTYGIGVLNSNNSYDRIVHFIQPAYNSSNINISMTYLQNNVPTSSTAGVKDNYNLYVTNNGSTLSSVNSNSSTEMIYKALSSDENYSLRIRKYSGESSEVRYAYAWSTDNERYYNNSGEEGIYYLRNYKSSYYLTKNTTNNRSTQKSYNDSLNSLWILDYIASSGTYTIKNSNLTSYGLCLDTAISSVNYYAVDNTTSAVNPITIQYNASNGTYTFKQTVGGIVYALGINGNSTSEGAYANWSPYSAGNDSQKWYLETANFRLGDVNCDGTINNDDVSLIQSEDSGMITLNNMQRYLADANKTDTVTMSDIVAVLHIIATS